MSNEGIGTTTICQIAVVVRDIEKTAAAYADLFGLPVPTARLTDTADKTHARYRGHPTDARAKLAFFHFGPLSLELIEPVGGPSTWAEHLEAHGEGVHHIAFRVEGMDDVVAGLEAKGLTTVQRGDFTGGRYAYIDALEPLKVMLELLESVPVQKADG
ncbi:VOC family protein [bacterium]|nr:VOC family protein [bacterium]